MANQKKPLDPRIRRTQQYLREALIDLVIDIGYQQITVTKLAQSALINRSTFYLHYQDIDHLLTAGFETYWDHVLPGTTLFIFDKPVLPAEQLQSLLESDLTHFDHLRDFYRVMLCEEINLRFKTSLLEHLEKITRERFSPPYYIADIPNLTLQLTHTWAASAYQGVILEWLEAKEPEPIPALAAELTDLFLHTFQDSLNISVCGRIDWHSKEGIYSNATAKV